MSRAVLRMLSAAFVGILVACAAFGASPSYAQSKYPDRPIRIVVPYGPGGVADVTARLVADKVSQSMGQSFVIENRPGAGMIAGAKAVQSSPADGYTLLLAGNGQSIVESLFKTLPFKIVDDFVPIAALAEFEIILATKAESKFDTVQKLVEYAKANPGKLNFGTITTGSTQNLAAELFKMTTGIEASLIPFRTTGDLMTAIMRGDVDVGFDFMAALGSSITGKQMTAIATAGEERNEQLPNVPTVKESGFPTYVVTSWNAFYGPAGVPKDVIAKLSEHVAAAVKTEDIRKRMGDLGMRPMAATPEIVDKRMRSEIAKWAEVIKVAGIEKQ